MHPTLLKSLGLLLVLFVGHARAEDLETQRRLFVDAEKALAGNDYESYGRLANRLSSYPLFPYLEYTRLTQQLDRDDEIAAFLQRHRDSRYAGYLRRRWLADLAGRQQWTRLVAQYRETDDAASRCRYLYARYRSGLSKTVPEETAELWRVGRSQPEACDPLFSVWQQSPAFTSEQVWRRFELALKAGNTGLARYLRHFLDSRERPAADLWLEFHDRPGELEQCRDWGPAGRFAGRIFIHGLDRLASSDPYRALKLYQARRANFSLGAEQVRFIERRLGMALAFHRHPQAYEQLAKVGDEEASVREWRVRAALSHRLWPEVLAALDRLGPEERGSAEWLYWRGRAHEALGDREAARQHLLKAGEDRSFFGFLAAERADTSYNLTHRALQVNREAVERLATRPAFAEAREWRLLGRWPAARSAWWHAVAGLDKRQLLAAATLAREWGWHSVAIFTVARAQYWDDLELRFPLEYRREILENAGRQEMDPAIILGLVRQESAFDPFAQSPAGARGLMQIMPATGRGIARELREKWNSSGDLFDPGVNLRYGAAYYKKVLDRFDGNFAMAAAAYNAGPHRVEQWRPRGAALAADIWMETIPFRETRRYVAAVLSYAMIYRKRLQKPLVPMASYLPPVPPRDPTERTPPESLPAELCS